MESNNEIEKNHNYYKPKLKIENIIQEKRNITIRIKSFFYLNVINADNEIIVFTNSRLIYHNRTENNGVINERIRLGLIKGSNNVIVIGINWGGLSHFRFQIIKHSHGCVRTTEVDIDETPAGIGAIFRRIYPIYVDKDTLPLPYMCRCVNE